MNSFVDQLRTYEIEPAQMSQHPFVWLGLQHENDRGISGGRMLKSELVAQRGLAGPGTAGNEIGIPGQKTAVEQSVESLDSRSQPWMLDVSIAAEYLVRHVEDLDRESVARFARRWEDSTPRAEPVFSLDHWASGTSFRPLPNPGEIRAVSQLFLFEFSLRNANHQVLEIGDLTADGAHALNVGQPGQHFFTFARQRFRRSLAALQRGSPALCTGIEVSA
jgi:hypothetical protein